MPGAGKIVKERRAYIVTGLHGAGLAVKSG
jgi:hypothetical protein